MRSRPGRFALALVLVSCFASAVHAQSADPIFRVEALLESYDWNEFVLGPSSDDSGYVVEISPAIATGSSAAIDAYFVHPMFDGANWYDVLRVRLAPGSPSLNADIRVYRLVGMPVVHQFNAQLMGGVWHGFWFGRANWDRAYVVEITPMGPPTGCNTLEWSAVQQEFDGYNWNDVLRLMTPTGCAPLNVQVRAYEIMEMPVVHDADTQLLPGVWHEVPLGPSSLNRAYVTDITPTLAPLGCNYAGKSLVQPEFDGSNWNDVLRIMLPPSCAPQNVHIRVHSLPGADREVDLLTDDVQALAAAGDLNSGQSQSLIIKLAVVSRNLDDGKAHVARRLLNAFINEVADHVAAGVLTAEEGQSLIECAEGIIETLDG